MIDARSNRNTHSDPTMSIGALSRATDIPVNTIRTWERRYGYPEAHRTESGHRLYRPELVSHLRLVARALNSGYRPRQVLGRSVDDLRTMVGQSVRQGTPKTTGTVDATQWIKSVSSYDAKSLVSGFRSIVAQHGLISFASDYAALFLNELGSAWQEGRIEIHHEHFGSEVLRDFMVTQWRPLSLQAEGSPIVCGSLPGERHHMGLHLAACILTALGYKIVFLGADTPLDSLVATVSEARASKLVISSSVYAPVETTESQLSALRKALDSGVDIWVGGSPLATEIPGVTLIRQVRELAEMAAVES